jgi:PilZ domain
MNNAEKRKHARIPVRLPIQVSVRGQNYEAEITDISEGGAFVHGTIPVQIGGEVKIQIFGNPPIEVQERFQTGVQSIVRWVRGCTPTGFGVQFR